MAKKNNVYTFNKTNTKGVIKIEVGKKEYIIRNNEYFVNKAMKILNTMEDVEAFEILDCIFNALNYLYGEDVVEDIAINNPSIDWGEFLRCSIAMASGMTPEQYEESIKETEKNV